VLGSAYCDEHDLLHHPDAVVVDGDDVDAADTADVVDGEDVEDGEDVSLILVI
jgi:hypothetical protein